MMAWNVMQKKMMCCGLDGPRNWYDVNNNTALGIPPSCCKPQYIDKETQNCLKAAPLYMDRLYQVNKCSNYIYNLRHLNNLSIFRMVAFKRFTIAFLQTQRY